MPVLLSDTQLLSCPLCPGFTQPTLKQRLPFPPAPQNSLPVLHSAYFSHFLCCLCCLDTHTQLIQQLSVVLGDEKLQEACILIGGGHLSKEIDSLSNGAGCVPPKDVLKVYPQHSGMGPHVKTVVED